MLQEYISTLYDTKKTKRFEFTSYHAFAGIANIAEMVREYEFSAETHSGLTFKPHANDCC